MIGRRAGGGKAAAALVCLALATAARAQAVSRDEGIAAGPWLLAPTLGVGAGYDSNPLFLSEGGGVETEGDETYRLAPSLKAILPFRNSRLDLGASLSWRDYGQTELTDKTSLLFTGDLDLLFGSLDHVRLHGEHTDGSAESQEFDAGELVLQGQPYRYNLWSAEWSRENYGQPGWLVRAERSDLNFDSEVEVSFFDFRAEELGGEYRHPLGPSRWAIVSGVVGWSDHYCSGGEDPVGDPCPPVGVPFRSQIERGIEVGLRGDRGRDRPYVLRGGWSVLDYSGGGGGNYQGWVGDATIGFAPGRTRVLVTAVHRAWPSFYLTNNFYVADEVNLAVDHDWLQWSRVGAMVAWVGSSYPEPTEGVEGFPRRSDQTFRAEAYANLLPRERSGFRVSVSHQQRRSNIPGLDYEGTVFLVGIVVGWI